MSEKLIRVYKKMDFNDIRDHLLIYGDLAASCSKCKALDVKLDAAKCPHCQTEFKYISFRNIKHHLPKMQKLVHERPQMTMVDFEDYTRIAGALKAEEFLK
ncbi:MAG: hypothetical protein A2Z88_01800 [Omnitrophica WOR_2 bacterium GWA2_47_8]|nr:MAG: hypothetical protein A2Z88_01800 [Omnitrophica WOR_2 bacterium GWA2_47_8]